MRTEQNHILVQEGQPVISFIIPVYNVEAELLRECIESVRSLALRPDEREIIVVDDGSQEDYAALLADYSDEIVLIQQPNSGVSAARNTGLDRATGKYIQFVDGDDKLIATVYKQVLDSAGQTSADLVTFDFTKDWQHEEAGHYKTSPAVSGCELMRRSNLHGAVWCFLFRKDIASDLRFTPGIAYGEDEEFTARLLLRADTVLCTPAKAYFYRQHEASAIHNTSVRRKLKRLNDAKTIISHLNTLAYSLPEEKRTALQRRVHQLTMDYLYNIIRLTRSRHCLNRRLTELRHIGLYPLPEHNYTRKYKWFSRLANSQAGLLLLMLLIPLIPKER